MTFEAIKMGLLGVIGAITLMGCGGTDSSITAGAPKVDKKTNYIVVLKSKEEIVIKDKNSRQFGNTDQKISVRDRISKVMSRVTAPGRQQKNIGAAGTMDRIGHVYENALEGFSAELTDEEAERVEQDPDVDFVEKDQPLHMNVIQNRVPSWGIDRIDARNLPLDGAYDHREGDTQVHAYIIDTGIRLTHREFAGRIGDGIDIVSGDDDPSDCQGHGTHVAGTVGGTTYGVDKSAILHAVRVLSCDGSGTNSGVIAGIDWVKKHHQSPAVANMSLGGGESRALDRAVNNAVDEGIFFAVAAGNEAADACQSSPSRADKAMTVAASDRNDKFANYSNYGSCVDIIAPGSAIKSSSNAGDTASETMSGTSMATPHVAGVAALYLSHHPNATPAEVYNAILSDATQDHVSGIPSNTQTPNYLLYSLLDQGTGGGAQTKSWSTGAYGNNENRSTTLSIPGASSLTVTISGEVEQSYDFITIYDQGGNQIGRYSGQLNKTITVQGASIRIQFTSDGSVTKAGATIRISGQSDGGTGGGAQTKSWSTGAYGNNENRSTTLSIPGASSLTVTISGEVEQSYDFITIYDQGGNQIGRYSGQLNKTITVQGASIRIQFTSDGSVTKAGATIMVRG